MTSLVIAEHDNASIKGATLNTVTAALACGGDVHVLAKAGATAVIQPGGSVRDAEVIAAADEQNIAMVFTGFRHFRH